MYRHVVLHTAITVASPLQASSVREEACSEGFLNGREVVSADAGDGDFNAVAQLSELVADVTGAGEGTLLEEVFLGPDVGEVRVDPLIPDVEKGEMVPAFFDGETGTSGIGLQFLVFRSIKERRGLPKHGDYTQDLFGAAVFLGFEFIRFAGLIGGIGGKYCSSEHWIRWADISYFAPSIHHNHSWNSHILGNSAIWRPIFVSSPWLSMAPRAYNC